METTRIQVQTDLQGLEIQSDLIQLPTITTADSKWTVCCRLVCGEQDSVISDRDDLLRYLTDPNLRAKAEVFTVRITKKGKIVQSDPLILTEGANRGKANATSVLQAAVLKMRNLYKAMLKKRAQNEATTPTEQPDVQIRVNPMLLGLYKYQQSSEDAKQITFPCYVQRKYDGLRCVCLVSPSGHVQLFSRGQCEYTNLEHVQSYIKKVITEKPQLAKLEQQQHLVIDGELYQHGVTLQKLNSIIKNQKSNTKDIQFRVFDCSIYNPTSKSDQTHFRARLETMRSLLATDDQNVPVQVVETVMANDHAAVDALMNTYISEGYEGAVLRSVDSEYVFSINARRSNTTLKYKRRLDIEVCVTAFTQGNARDKGAIVFICNYNGLLFNVVQNIALVHRKQQFEFLLQHPEALEILRRIPLTVEHSGFSEAGIPQQPRGIVFRYDLVHSNDIGDSQTLFERIRTLF